MKASARLKPDAVRTLEPANERALRTPEGVDLRLRPATYAERAVAFLIDAGILIGLLMILTIGAFLIAAATGYRGAGLTAVGIIWMLGAFLLRNAYFMLFELRQQAATPGKRAMGLRVVARDGGRLTADAVIARNVMREIEIFLPLMFLARPGQGVDGALMLLGLAWTAVFTLFPMFNRERLRIGDMAAGTMVIMAPKSALLRDLAAAGAETGLRFTAAQLDAYGIKELHVLESVLRAGDRQTLREVSQRIRAKIGGTAADVSDKAFLEAYYAGLRDRLEGRMIMGKRRADKFDR